MTRAILAALAGLMVLSAQAAERRPIIMLDVQYDASASAGETDASRAADAEHVKKLAERLRARLAASPGYELVKNEAVSRELSGFNLGACGRCELVLGKKAGAELVLVVAVQKVSPLLINVSAFIYEVADGSAIAAGATTVHGSGDEDWERAARYLADRRLKLGGG